MVPLVWFFLRFSWAENKYIFLSQNNPPEYKWQHINFLIISALFFLHQKFESSTCWHVIALPACARFCQQQQRTVWAICAWLVQVLVLAASSGQLVVLVLKREMPAIVYLLPAIHFASTVLSSFTCILFSYMCYNKISHAFVTYLDNSV